MVDWHCGTIGFTYPEWRGSFYPVGLPGSQSLSYFSHIFNAVEINTTFYGAQSVAQVQRWAAATPPEFRFCLKTPRQITHELRLRDAGDEMRAFIDPLRGLEAKLGAVLLQLPPGLTIEERPALENFLKLLPRDTRIAIEFRHGSWYVPETASLLRQYGICWAATDYENLPARIYLTADFLYIRWIGKHNVIPHPGHEIIDRSARLEGWLERIRAHLDEVQDIYGFFDNDYAGHAPGSCNRFKAMAGLPVVPSSGEEQGKLF